jgi:hypothetical protein
MFFVSLPATSRSIDRVSRFLRMRFVSDNLGYPFRRVEVFHDINQRVENIDRFDY